MLNYLVDYMFEGKSRVLRVLLAFVFVIPFMLLMGFGLIACVYRGEGA